MEVLLPIVISFIGSALVAVTPSEKLKTIRILSLTTATAGFLAVLYLYFGYDNTKAGFQGVVKMDWIKNAFNADFHLGYDGISLTLVLLTGIIAVCGVLASWNISHRTNAFFGFYFALIGGVYGVFLSLDLFLLFVFYEIAIVPKYFLIAIWGSTRREYASMQLVIYSIVGSAFALLGLFAIYLGSNHGFNIPELITKSGLGYELQTQIFPFIFIGFGILAGMFPFHTWAPTGHSAAPTAASMLLAGVVMKLGAYGCLRVGLGILPVGAHYWAGCIGWLSAFAIVYGALIALSQKDFKYVIGYSSVSHMGFVLLGLSTLSQMGLVGATLQMFSHGIIGALLFAIVGGLIYERTHTRNLDTFNHLFSRMPAIAWLFIIAGCASMGLPLFSGFIAELHIILGLWQSTVQSVWLVVLVGIGIVLTFAYTLIKIHEAFFRKAPVSDEHFPKSFEPLAWNEKALCGILIICTLVIGLFPFVLTDIIETGLRPIIKTLEIVSR